MTAASIASVESDICIIGAGPVGLTVARGLIQAGHRVVVIERGTSPATQQSANTDVSFSRRIYRGATSGRAFGAGGTSALWGGQLLPMRGSDFHARPQVGAPAWPLDFNELAPHFERLERWLAVEPGRFTALKQGAGAHPLARLEWGAWTPRFSKWIPFTRRNVFSAFAPTLARSTRFRLCLNARANSWRLREESGLKKLTSVGTVSSDGKHIEVRARRFVICAGALESARCILQLQDAAGELSEGVRAFAGRYLHDHLSLRLAQVLILDRADFQRLFAPVFAGATMRSLRMELSEAELTRLALPALYAHFVAESAPNSSFSLLRDLLRHLQHRQLTRAWAAALRIPQALPGLVALIGTRLLRKRLDFPREAAVYLHCDFEQPPLRENCLSLDGDDRVKIDWDYGEGLAQMHTVIQSAFMRFWQANSLDKIARLDPQAIDTVANIHDIYHPAGTTRMAARAADGVVDTNLKVYGTSNVYVAGSAVFPSLGAANPTFTAMALGSRLADFIHLSAPPDG